MNYQQISLISPMAQTTTDSAFIIIDKYLNIRYSTRQAKMLLLQNDTRRFSSLEQMLPSTAIETIKGAIATLMGTVKKEMQVEIVANDKIIIATLQPLQGEQFQVPYFSISIEETKYPPKRFDKFKQNTTNLANALTKESNGLDMTKPLFEEAAAIFHCDKEGFHALAELGFDAVMIYGLETKKMVYCSNRAIHFFGYDSKAALLQTSPLANSPVYQPDGIQSLDKIVEYVHHVRKNSRQFDFEWDIQRRNGTSCTCWTSIFPIDSEVQRYVLITLRDISEQKQRQRELEKRNAFIEKVTESYPHIIQILDLTQAKVVYNNAKAGYLGYTKAEIEYSMSIAMKNVLHPDDWNLFMQQILYKVQSLGNDETLELEVRIKNKAGVYRWYQTTFYVFSRTKKGNVKEITMISTDINAKKLAELQLTQKMKELEEKNRELQRYAHSNSELENFAYIASHDLREPLRTIRSFTQLLKRRYHKTFDDRANEYMSLILGAAKNMDILINDLLTYSTVNGQDFDIAPIETRKLLSKVLHALNVKIKNRNAIVEFENLPATILGNDTKLYQVFLNLINNAIKFTKNDVRPKIIIRAIDCQTHWEFAVQDNGIGIPADYFEKIFQLFIKLESKYKSEGTGLGLAICKKVIDMHGGKIWVDSEVGVGTTFYFTLNK